MCVIFHVLPGKKIPSEKLFIACANNWHSWGLIIKKGKKLEVHRKVPENANLPDTNKDCGGCHCDIGEIEDLLYSDENINFDRYLHLRHATKGHVNEENCHPFLIESGKREVYLMHNGGINGCGTNVTSMGYGYTPSGQRIENAPSDTKEFVEKYLQIPLKEFVKGDYTNKAFQEFFWNPLYLQRCQSSRFLFISNDLPDLKVGAWVSTQDPETQETLFYSSNNDYFTKIERGPLRQQEIEQERLRREKEKAEEARRASTALTSALDNGISISPYRQGIFEIDKAISEGLNAIFQTFGEGLVPGEIADLGELGVPEWEAVINTLLGKGETITIAYLIDKMMTEYLSLYKDREQLELKHSKATKLVADLKTEISQKEYGYDARKHASG